MQRFIGLFQHCSGFFIQSAVFQSKKVIELPSVLDTLLSVQEWKQNTIHEMVKLCGTLAKVIPLLLSVAIKVKLDTINFMIKIKFEASTLISHRF